MAHLKKFSKSATGHMAKHFERGKDDEGKYIKFGNQDIDTSKSHLNYNLAPQRLGQVEFIRSRCSEVKCLNRADVKVMCSWVVTKPKDFNREEEFFMEAYKFLENRYGKENVVSAYVHKDEITPHMHFSFVPVVYDKKKELYKVSAKERIPRSDLISFHSDLEKALGDYFGVEVGILNEITKKGNKSIEDLKRGTAQEEIKKAKVEASKIVFTANKELDYIKYSLSTLKREYDTKKSVIEHSIENEKMFSYYPDYVEIKKKSLLSKEDYVFLPQDKFDQTYKELQQFRTLQNENKLLENQVNYLNELNPIEEIKALEEENNILKNKNTFLNKNLDYLIKEKEGLESEKNELVAITKKLNSFYEYATNELKENKNELLELREISKKYKLVNDFLDKYNYRNKFEIYKIVTPKEKAQNHSKHLER